MGSKKREFTSIADVDAERSDENASKRPLGDLLSGRFDVLDVDSVEAVRRLREDG